jgi:KaiC/GvpD/RAD55 family RecA-like ATPase
VLPRIPLIEDLTTAPIPAGSNILVEFDPASQWYNASLTIAAGWIRTGGSVSYNTFAQSPATVRAQLNRLGVNTEELEAKDQLRIWDWYTASLGQKSKEKYAIDSLKAADLSIVHAKTQLPGPPIPDRLRISDNTSALGRFNDEKSWIEFALTRGIPTAVSRQSTSLHGMMAGIHSDWAYKQVEGASDGTVDFKLDEEAKGETVDVMRVRNFRNVFSRKDGIASRLASTSKSPSKSRDPLPCVLV